MGFEKTTKVKWSFSKVVEEPEFGPGLPVKTVYIVGELEPHDGKLEGLLLLILLLVSISSRHYALGPCMRLYLSHINTTV